MNNEDFEAKVRQEVSKIRNRKEEERSEDTQRAKKTSWGVMKGNN